MLCQSESDNLVPMTHGALWAFIFHLDICKVQSGSYLLFLRSELRLGAAKLTLQGAYGAEFLGRQFTSCNLKSPWNSKVGWLAPHWVSYNFFYLIRYKQTRFNIFFFTDSSEFLQRQQPDTSSSELLTVDKFKSFN